MDQLELQAREYKFNIDLDGKSEIESHFECPINITLFLTQLEGNSRLSDDCEYQFYLTQSATLK